jgi:hypothetical protein
MTHALVSELVAIIRRCLREPARPLTPALTRALEAGGFPFVEDEVAEIARRARGRGATDEELGLSIAAVLALSQTRTRVS